MVSKKEMEESKEFKEIIKDKSIFGLIGFIIRYKTKELLFAIIILLVGYILASNISYKDGKWEWIPSIKTNIEIKK